ncbi:MAG: hypothetical protein II272_05140 [Oscillospiraceae bacterium]|nr:hypothetical protein [Oscillospiraceae bacterium]
MRPVGKGLYVFALIAWILNICLVVLSFLVAVPKLWVAGSFLCTFGILASSHAHSFRISALGGSRGFDLFLCIVVGIMAAVDAVCFFSLMLAGGEPEIVDGLRCVVSHGKIVARDISEARFRYLWMCETAVFSVFYPLLPATFVLLWVRLNYRLGGKENEA